MPTPAGLGAVPGQDVAVIVNPADLALLVAIEAFILARGLHPDDVEQAEDWGEVCPGIQTFDL